MAKGLNNDDPAFYVKGIHEGNVAILGRAITLVESRNATQRDLARRILERLDPSEGTFRLGITGVPGVGKSTFIESFGNELLRRGHRVAVLAVDPSSTRSGGSILGDKTRMESLSTKPGVFIRPSPSGGNLGGVTRVTSETIQLCEAAGFDFILVETVGVGQSEIAVNGITDFFLLLMLAGAGDELQGIKRGIMEMADALVVTKADGGNREKALAARAEYAHAMHLLPASESGWTARAMVCSSLSGEGIAAVCDMLDEYRTFTMHTGYFARKRQLQQYGLLEHALREQVLDELQACTAVQEALAQLKDSGAVVNPLAKARELAELFFRFKGKG